MSGDSGDPGRSGAAKPDPERSDPERSVAATKDPKVYFAAERTFLAWIRTGLGLMGVGFAVSRFGLFLREMRASETHAVVQPSGFSVVAGVGLVALGVIVNLAAVVHHVRTVHQLQAGNWMPGIARNAAILAMLLAIGGIGLGIYLIMIR